MAKMTLTYFDFPASRGEECRLALHLAGVDFTDERLKKDEWEKRKASTPFGALPVLTAEGHTPIAQSNAILRLVGGLHGLHPSEPWEAARHEGVMGAVEDFRVRFSQTRRSGGDEQKKLREEFKAGYLREWSGHVEAQIKGPFVGGKDIQVADLKLFVTLAPFMKGSMDHVPAESFGSFKKLTDLYNAAAAHPKVVSWYAR